MLTYPSIDPVVFAVGPITVYWYGVMYLIGFLGGGALGVLRARASGSTWSSQQVWDLLFYVAVGVIVGGRLGYVLFYNVGYYLEHPIALLYIWSGGMSFHGGLIGVCVALALYARRSGRSLLGAGRLGNFINEELWGRVSDVPWAMIFPSAGPLARHPSQLYEAGLEGLLLFLIIWTYSSKPRVTGSVSGLFLICYALFRFTVEFFREPDAHLGLVFLDGLSMGQLLCLPMLIAGLWLLLAGRSRQT